MTHWPWYVGGAALAGVAVFHWLALHRMMAVSGRYSALVNRLRFGAPKAAPKMSADELRAALLAATAAEFGPLDGGGDCAAPEPTAKPAAPPVTVAAPTRRTLALTSPQSLSTHVLFLAALAVGGFVSAQLAGSFAVTGGLRSELFAQLFPGKLGAPVLLVGGVLVGFGTRMAAGCTSGHGLCGVSRLQVGSLLTTAAFFGVGIATSFALGALL